MEAKGQLRNGKQHQRPTALLLLAKPTAQMSTYTARLTCQEADGHLAALLFDLHTLNQLHGGRLLQSTQLQQAQG